jgi:hypothetical protein
MKSEETEEHDTGLDPWECRVEATLTVVIGPREVATMNWTWDENLERQGVYIRFTQNDPDLVVEQLQAVTRIAELAGPLLEDLEKKLAQTGEAAMEPIHG